MTPRLRFHLWLWSLLCMWATILTYGWQMRQLPQLWAERARFASYEARIIHLEELIHRNAELETREMRRQRQARERKEEKL